MFDESQYTVVETSEKHKVYIKNTFTRLEGKQIRRVIRRYVAMNPETTEIRDMTMDDLYQASLEVAYIVIAKIVMPDGVEAKSVKAAIEEMLEDDEDLIIKKVNEITKNMDLPKKNEISSTTNLT